MFTQVICRNSNRQLFNTLPAPRATPFQHRVASLFSLQSGKGFRNLAV